MKKLLIIVVVALIYPITVVYAEGVDRRYYLVNRVVVEKETKTHTTTKTIRPSPSSSLSPEEQENLWQNLFDTVKRKKWAKKVGLYEQAVGSNIAAGRIADKIEKEFYDDEGNLTEEGEEFFENSDYGESDLANLVDNEEAADAIKDGSQEARDIFDDPSDYEGSMSDEIKEKREEARDDLGYDEDEGSRDVCVVDPEICGY